MEEPRPTTVRVEIGDDDSVRVSAITGDDVRWFEFEPEDALRHAELIKLVAGQAMAKRRAKKIAHLRLVR